MKPQQLPWQALRQWSESPGTSKASAAGSDTSTADAVGEEGQLGLQQPTGVLGAHRSGLPVDMEGAGSAGSVDGRLGSESKGSAPVTTLMISYIPCRVPQQRLADELEALGFGDTYDFLYTPTGGRSGAARSLHLGYAFVNFISPDDAELFASVFEGFRFPGCHSERGCAVRAANVQGLADNIRRLCRAVARRGAEGPDGASRLGGPLLLVDGIRVTVSAAQLAQLLGEQQLL